MKDWHRISLVYIGGVIGAGFASGQEIFRFFIVYGKKSFFGIMLSGVLFGLVVSCVLCKTYVKQVKSLNEYFADIAGSKATAILTAIITLFMFSSFCVMIAGSGALFSEHLYSPAWSGIIVMCLLCAVIFYRDIAGIVALNAVLTPLMIIGIFFLGLYAYFAKKTSCFILGHGMFSNWLTACFVYISYNTLTTVPIMTALNKLLHKKSDAVKTGLMCGIILFILSAVLWAALSTNEKWSAQIPFLHTISNISPIAHGLYIPILFIAMATTAVSSGFGVIKTIKSRLKINNLLIIFILCTFGALISFSGFSHLVERLYSFFGIIGMGVLVVIIIDGFKYLFMRKPKKKGENHIKGSIRSDILKNKQLKH